MNFDHTEDRRMLSDMLRRFGTEQYAFEVRERHAQTAEGFSPEYWKRYADLGAVGALFTEQDGGYGGAGFDISVVFEALGHGLVLAPFLGTLMAGSVLAASDAPAHKALLGELVEGNTVLAFAHAEAQAEYEASYVQTEARAEGDTWVLSGSKAVVAQGEHASHFVVSARTSGDTEDEAGLTLFLIPRDTPGLRTQGYGLIDGGRAADITLDAVRIDDGARLSAVDGGFAAIERALGKGILAVCSEAIGIMDFIRDATLDYLQTRKQFGVAIGSFQALQHRMADIATDIEQARSAVINAAALIDSPDRVAREKALSAAKYTIGRAGIQVAEETIQLHGGIGMTWELPLSHYAKRLVMIDHQLGDEDHHLERYVQLSRK